uniref:Uncharacterized protein n=1 Tax=viral metagenome TaxID=1070528 RepID=A0A2V0R9D1_9ZZZZ
MPNMSRFDLMASPPTPMANDPISQAMNLYWMPVFERFMTAALRSATLPTMQAIMTYYNQVEQLYQRLCFPILLNHLYENFQWSEVRANNSDTPPPCIEELAERWKCRPYEFENNWMKYIHELSHHCMLPNIAPLLDRGACAYFMDDYDQTLRIDAYYFDEYADSVGPTIVTYLTNLDTIMTNLQSSAYRATQQFILNFLPYRAGIPQPAMIGVSPPHAISWWNQSFFSQDDITDAACATSALASECVCSNTSGTNGTTLNQSQTDDQLMVATYADDISVAEWLLVTAFNTYLYTGGGPSWGYSLQTFFHDRGTYLPMDDGSELYIDNQFTAGGQVFTLANDKDMYQYDNAIQARFVKIINDNISPTNRWRGMRHYQMSPTHFEHSEAYEVMYLAGVALNGIKWLNHLSAVVAGSFPRSIHYSIEAAFAVGN